MRRIASLTVHRDQVIALPWTWHPDGHFGKTDGKADSMRCGPLGIDETLSCTGRRSMSSAKRMDLSEVDLG